MNCSVWSLISMDSKAEMVTSGLRAVLSPLADHSFYGLGLAAGIALC